MAVKPRFFEEVRPLVDFVASAVKNTHAVGLQTDTIYDTAWVSILRKRGEQSPTLLFPQCFQYVLDQQLPHGGWESYNSTIDGIVNTLGGLLALKKNSNINFQDATQEEIDARVNRAVLYLEEQLQEWNVATADHVGFEIVIPAVMDQLEQEGIHFDFPGRAQLMALNKQKLAKIPPSIWSKKMQTTLTHSLESFVGKVDFDTLGHLLVYGCMGSSPAATAAYLLYASTWDEEAESYLRHLVDTRTHGGVFTGVPTMFPSTGFEVLWVASTLLEYGFHVTDFPGLSAILEVTDEFFDAQNGLASGFSNLSVPDADDTAKSILVRNLLGVPTMPDKLIARFEGSTHFLTYDMERHPSLTTNCNILSAILESPHPMEFIGQIEKCARFLVAAWSRPDIPFADKWSISEFYPTMLMSESLIRLLKFWDAGVVHSLPDDLILRDVPLVLLQLLLYTLQKQHANGSWGPKPSREITAYAVIALSNLASLPFIGDLAVRIQAAIEKGRWYIQFSEDAPEIEYVWIAKTTYSPINVGKAYIVSALATTYPKYSLSSTLTNLLDVPQKGMKQYTTLYSRLPCLRDLPLWRIQGSILEGYLHLRKLTQVRIDMFGRANMKKDEYFEFIAMTFACANNLQNAFLNTDVIYQMMILVLRVYQVDEFVEHIIGKQFRQSLDDIKRAVNEIFQKKHACGGSNRKEGEKSHVSRQMNGYTNGHTNGPANGHANGDNNGHINGHQKPSSNSANGAYHETDKVNGVSGVYQELSAFVCSITCHPMIRSANQYDRDLLSYELQQCLLSHIAQIEDSEHFVSANGAKKAIPRGSFHGWVRTTAASHSCAPLSLAFLTCLVAVPKQQSKTAEEQYLIQDLWVHLSNKARMENDRASLRRDRKEKNLNSLDFPEFDQSKDEKKQISAILNYERRCIELAFDALGQVCAGKSEHLVFDALKFYYFLSDIYSDIYSLKDISCEG